MGRRDGEFTIPLTLWRDPRFRAAWESRSNETTWVSSDYGYGRYSFSPQIRDRKTIRNRFRKTLHKLEPGIAARDGKRCGHCGRVRGVVLRLDHVLPIAWGGTNELWNLQLLCERCNTRKGDRLPAPPRPAPVMFVNLIRREAA